MKSLEEYLAMTPPKLAYEKWAKEVREVFDSVESGRWTEEEGEDYLDFLFDYEPRSMLDRWRDEARAFEEEAERKEEEKRRLGG